MAAVSFATVNAALAGAQGEIIALAGSRDYYRGVVHCRRFYGEELTDPAGGAMTVGALTVDLAYLN